MLRAAKKVTISAENLRIENGVIIAPEVTFFDLNLLDIDDPVLCDFLGKYSIEVSTLSIGDEEKLLQVSGTFNLSREEVNNFLLKNPRFRQSSDSSPLKISYTIRDGVNRRIEALKTLPSSLYFTDNNSIEKVTPFACKKEFITITANKDIIQQGTRFLSDKYIKFFAGSIQFLGHIFTTFMPTIKAGLLGELFANKGVGLIATRDVVIANQVVNSGAEIYIAGENVTLTLDTTTQWLNNPQIDNKPLIPQFSDHASNSVRLCDREEIAQIEANSRLLHHVG